MLLLGLAEGAPSTYPQPGSTSWRVHKLFIFIICSNITWINVSKKEFYLILKSEALDAVLLLGLAAGVPSTYFTPTRVNLVESPYYLPGITNNVELIAEVPGKSVAKAYRMMGAPSGAPGGSQLALTYENAYRACQDVGLGLASILDDSHKAALDKIVTQSIAVSPEGVAT